MTFIFFRGAGQPPTRKCVSSFCGSNFPSVFGELPDRWLNSCTAKKRRRDEWVCLKIFRATWISGGFHIHTSSYSIKMKRLGHISFSTWEIKSMVFFHEKPVSRDKNQVFNQRLTMYLLFSPHAGHAPARCCKEMWSWCHCCSSAHSGQRMGSGFSDDRVLYYVVCCMLLFSLYYMFYFDLALIIHHYTITYYNASFMIFTCVVLCSL